MIWKKDKFRPTQPYFVLESENFRQEIYLQHGISHFYSFTVNEPQTLRVVPDACIDFFFEYTENGMEAYACGSVSRFHAMEWKGKREVFGVRFMPGEQPANINATMKEVAGGRVPLKEILLDNALLTMIEKEKDYSKRIEVFLGEYLKFVNPDEIFQGKKELIWSAKRMVYDTDGQVKVQEIAQKTGYTQRYVNKVFIEQMGFSPKTFCKIIQFQRALEFLNYGAPDKMTDAATYLGYYDQSQFIRDFKEYCGLTPLQYLKMVRESNYKGQISSDLYN